MTCPPNPGPKNKLEKGRENWIYSGRTGEKCQRKPLQLNKSSASFSKLKTFLRRAGARTREALQEAIVQALQTVTAQDAQGWFQHGGNFPQAGG